jgi:DNA-directed RNA polymerase subunit beta'
MTPVIDGGDIIESLGDRVLGRVVAKDVIKPGTRRDRHHRRHHARRAWIRRLEEMGIDEIEVRSPITCETRHGICSTCYGRDLARGHRVNMGEAIGVVAAQSIGEPGTQLTMRTFHIGGAASRATAQDNIQIINDGTVRLHNVKTVERKDGTLIAVSRSGELSILDKVGRERERYKLPYGAIIKVGRRRRGDGRRDRRDLGSAHAPDHHRGGGYGEVQRHGRGHHHQAPDRRAHRSVQHRGDGSRASARPRARTCVRRSRWSTTRARSSAWRTPTCRALLPPRRALVGLEDGARVEAGDVLARIPQEGSKTRDITGGLPRVADLFEARKPKEPAILAEISGTVSFGKETKGKRRLVITPTDGKPLPTVRSLRGADSQVAQPVVFEGESVQKGEMISEGPLSPHDILRLKGIAELAKYIVNEIQEVYRLQGVKINDKHIEVIVRQMLRKVVITSPGDSSFMIKGEQVEYTTSWRRTSVCRPRARCRPTASASCWVSPRRRWPRRASSPRPRSRRPPACSRKRRSPASATTCAVSRRTWWSVA